jgi:uncharacterized protein (DUF2336 family)
MAAAALSLIPELEDAVQRGTAEQRADILRRVTSLFLAGAPSFNGDHVQLFDDVFGRLVKEIESKARAELAVRLAPVENAPLEILRRLARDDDISVAGPVLSQSPRLPQSDLLDIAQTKSQAHLFAISGREGIDESVTEVLVKRGDRDVVRKVVANPGARLSEASFSGLVERAECDEELAETVAQRPDVPDHVFRELVLRATEVVQRRLLASAKPETQAEIRRVLAKVSEEVGARTAVKRDYSQAQLRIDALRAGSKLGEVELREFAGAGHYEDMVAALAALCAIPVTVADRLLNGDRSDPVLILCKAMGFSWATARAIILARPVVKGKSPPALDSASVNFDKLSASTAQRVVRFWQAGSR